MFDIICFSGKSGFDARPTLRRHGIKKNSKIEEFFLQLFLIDIQLKNSRRSKIQQKFFTKLAKKFVRTEKKA